MSGRGGRIVVIGASGQIGSHLMTGLQRVLSSGTEVLGTSRQGRDGLLSFDLADPSAAFPVATPGPEDTVVLLAAVANPNTAFARPDEARLINVSGARRIVELCADTGARLVFFSSVEVFDGKQGPFREDAQTAPLNVYGQTKAQIESSIRTRLDPMRYCIVRTPWNVGFRPQYRCVVKMTYGAMLSPGAKMATDNMLSVIDIRDTVDGLLRLLADPSTFVAPTLHFAATEFLSRTELADRIRAISLFGPRMAYEPVAFETLDLPEARSRDSRLDSSLSREALSMSYRPLDATVAEKVALLDEWLETGLDLNFG